MRIIFPILVLALSVAAMAAAQTPSIQGLWVTDDRSALVQIAPCGRLLCGTVAKMLNTGPDVPRTDVHNPDPRLRVRPILGMKVLSGFSGAGTAWTGGRAYDPKSGKSYRSSLGLAADGSLEVTGCILFFCQTRHWRRQR
jgi:uncharacterized protein (DUF2147 family)